MGHQPGDRGRDDMGGQRDRGSAQGFTKVGPADRDLRPRVVAQIAARDAGHDSIFKIAMGVQADDVTMEQPDKYARGEDDLPPVQADPAKS